MDVNSLALTSLGSQSGKRSDALSPTTASTKLPKIVLRNSMGFELRTNTTYQNAIYRAKTKLMEPNRRLTDMEWRLPHAPVPSRPDYSRSLEYDDFRALKKPTRPLDPHKVEHWDMSFWNYLLPDMRLDRSTVNLPTMEKYYRSRDAVPNAEFMDTHNFRSLTNVQQLVLPIVSSRFALDKLIPGFDKMDYRKKMIMTQVLSNLLQEGFSSLEDLPANVRNDVLMELAKLAGEGKLTAEMQEKLFSELAQNLSALPPDVRAKVTEQLIKSMENLPPEVREQVLQQLLGTIDTLSEEDRQKVLQDLVKNLSSMPEESRHALLGKLMDNMDSLPADAKMQLLQGLLRDADTLPPGMRENILQNLIDGLDNLSPEERERVLGDLTKNLANLPPNIRQQLLEKLLEKSEELPPELRDQMFAELLKNVPEMPEELKRKLVVELLKNVDNMDPSLRQNVMKEILNNLDLIDGTMHGQVLQDFLKTIDTLPSEERDQLLKKIIEKSSTLDDPEMKRQLLEEILKNPSNLSANALQELVKNAGELPADLQQRLFNELLQKKDELPPAVLEELIRNSANVPPAVLTELLKSVDKLAPSSLTELAKHLNHLPEEVRTKLLNDMMNSMDKMDDEQRAALIGELLKNQENLNPQQLETLMKNLDELDPSMKEKVMKSLIENMENIPPAVKEKLIQDLLNNQTDMDQETRVKLLSQLLDNSSNLTQDEKEKIFKQLMQEIDQVTDPEMKKKLMNNMLNNLKDLPPETVEQFLSNLQDLPVSEQKELLKQILEKFDELPPEMKEKLVDDLLKTAAGLPPEVQKQMISDLLNEMKDLSADERAKFMQKVLDNPNLDPSVRAKLMEEMLKNVDDLPPEERQKLLEKMLEDSENLNPEMKKKLMDEMIKNLDRMPAEKRERFLAGLANDPDKKGLLKDLMTNGQLSSEMKAKLLDEMTKKPLNPSTLVDVLKGAKEIAPEMLDKVLKSVDKMSPKELNELAKNLDGLPPAVKQRVMQQMMKNLKNLDPKTQATILREMLRNSIDMDPKMVTELIQNIQSLTPTAIKELFVKADKLPPEALKELLKHIGDIPPAALEELIKNLDQLSPDVIASLLASKDLPPALREKLLKEINSNKKLKDKLKTLDPLAQGVQGVGKVVPKAKPEVKKPKITLPTLSTKSEKQLKDLYERLFGKEAAARLDLDLEVLANIDESELEDLLHDPDFLNMDPNLPPEVRRRMIEEIRKKRAKQRIADIPPLSKDKLQEIEDPLDYLYKYCIIHPDRMATYERVFLNTIKKQKSKFEGQNPPEHTTKLITLKRSNTDGGQWTNVGGAKYLRDSKQYHALDSSDEDEDPEKPNITKRRDGPNMINFEKEIRDAAFDSDVPPMKSQTAQQLDKINFIIDDLRKKEAEVNQTLQAANEQLSQLTSQAIMDLYPEVLDPEFDAKKKKSKGPEKSITELKSYGSLYTTEQLLARLSKSQIQIVDGQTEIKQTNGQISWSKNKLAQLRMRIDMLLGEQESLIARDQEERQQAMYKYQRVEKFRRAQSPLWNALNPSIDYEMNVEELEKALRQINGNLISPKECQYLKFILKIPGVKRLNLKVFSLIAALSEKVNQIEPFVRKLINKFDYEALDIKMLKAKELFYLMADKSQKLAPKGYVPIHALCVELAAGGVERENIEYCKKKFDREGKNYVDFMDWLIYVPLFVEIHQRIVSNPFLRYEDPLKPPKETVTVK